MDYMLPGMDGLEATTLLKTDPTTAAIPIIVLTGVLTKADEKKARAAGCDAYITKPFRQQEFQATIGDLVGVDLFHASIDALLLKSGPYTVTAQP